MEQMGQVVHPCGYWVLGVPPTKSKVERVGQLELIRPDFLGKNIASRNTNAFNPSFLGGKLLYGLPLFAYSFDNKSFQHTFIINYCYW
jgi:hypothetical protein